MNAKVVVVICLAAIGLYLVTRAGRGERAYQKALDAYGSGDYERAMVLFDKAARLLPDDPAVFCDRATVRANLGDLEGALTDYQRALQNAEAMWGGETDPSMAHIYYSRGTTYHEGGRLREAITDYEDAFAADADYPNARNMLAWCLATAADEKLRDPARALKLALHACEQSRWRDGYVIDTLAAAYAASGDFDNAVKTQQKAIVRLPDGEDKTEFQERLELYESGQPYVSEE